MGWAALTAICQHFFPDFAEMLSNFGIMGHGHGHSHSHGGGDFGPNINAAWLAAGSIVIKEWLYRASEYLDSADSRLSMLTRWCSPKGC